MINPRLVLDATETMQVQVSTGQEGLGRLSSKPQGSRRVAWDGGAFETAHRPFTAVVEGTIKSSDHLVMVTLRGGADRHELSTDDGHRYDGPDRPGSVSFLPAGCERRLRLHGVAWRWASLAFKPELLAQATGGARLPAFSGTDDGFVLGLLGEFERLDALDGGLDPAYCHTMSFALAAYLARRYAGLPVLGVEGVAKLPAWKLRRLNDYIEAHLGEELRIPDLARLAGLSEGHFHRVFRVTTGQTPLAYVNARRVRVAMQILAKEIMPIAQLALMVGFLSPSHFTRIFRQVTGQNPSRYRALSRVD